MTHKQGLAEVVINATTITLCKAPGSPSSDRIVDSAYASASVSVLGPHPTGPFPSVVFSTISARLQWKSAAPPTAQAKPGRPRCGELRICRDAWANLTIRTEEGFSCCSWCSWCCSWCYFVCCSCSCSCSYYCSYSCSCYLAVWCLCCCCFCCEGSCYCECYCSRLCYYVLGRVITIVVVVVVVAAVAVSLSAQARSG